MAEGARYSSMLTAKKNAGAKTVDFDMVSEMAVEECGFADEEEVLAMLQLFHPAGFLTFFNEAVLREIVILNVQLMADAFRCVIGRPDMFNPSVKLKFPQQWKKFISTGVVCEKVLLHLWKPFRIDVEVWIALMDKYVLLCPKMSDSDVPGYFVTAMLPDEPIALPAEIKSQPGKFPSCHFIFKNARDASVAFAFALWLVFSAGESGHTVGSAYGRRRTRVDEILRQNRIWTAPLHRAPPRAGTPGRRLLLA